jgi:hypothetical protein
MSHQFERRAANRSPDDAPSPEILAVLVMCGAEIRESDRAALPQVRTDLVRDRRSHDRRRQDRRRGDRRVAGSAPPPPSYGLSGRENICGRGG